MIPFAAGNFIYIGASDLIPEIKEHENLSTNIQNFLAFFLGISLMLIIKFLPES
ncbi:ZIP family metal transporter [Kaarinaea lacus]